MTPQGKRHSPPGQKLTDRETVGCCHRNTSSHLGAALSLVPTLTPSSGPADWICVASLPFIYSGYTLSSQLNEPQLNYPPAQVLEILFMQLNGKKVFTSQRAKGRRTGHLVVIPAGHTFLPLWAALPLFSTEGPSPVSLPRLNEWGFNGADSFP